MNLSKLAEVLKDYKNGFDARWSSENYKLQNIKTFQDNWDIDADNFVEMLERAIPNTNLLNARNFFPRGMIIAFANCDSEKVRSMFRNLYNEQLDLKERITHFIKKSEEIKVEYGAEEWGNHYQNENVVSIYLWLKYPDKYYIYKSSTYKNFIELLGYKPSNDEDAIKPIECFKFYDEIRDYVENDAELKEKYFNSLTPDLYNDTSLHTLVNDIAFYLYQVKKLNGKSKDFLIEALNNAQLKYEEDNKYYNVHIADHTYKILVRTYNGNYNYIAKSQLPELKDDIFVAIIWCNNSNPESIYLVPTTEWNNKESDIFVEHNYDYKQSEPEWGIQLTYNKEKQLEYYEFSNVINKLKGQGKMKNYWLYEPGEKAKLWNEVFSQNIIAIGWDELGDLTQYSSQEEISKRLQEIEQDAEHLPMNKSKANWEFANEMKQGDIVFVKDGASPYLIGRGIVESDYIYDDSRKEYKSIRKMKWTHKGIFNVDFADLGIKKWPNKTLTNISEEKYDDYCLKIDKCFGNNSDMEENSNSEVKYWWLNANPKIFKFDDIAVGDEQYYTLLNENGNKRRIYANFMEAKAGDLIIGYESTPIKQIVALGQVTNRDDKCLYFKKTENLINPINYSDIQDIPELKDMEYFKSAQGSLFKITNEEYNCLIDLIRDANPINKVVKNKPYSKVDYLKEVYQSDFEYETLKSLLLNKKNIILQGCPGIGKSFSAKRFAYSIMQEIDDSRIKFIQFHQNYSYEDFIMGYKPCENGFTLEKGVFYEFCKKAENDEQHRPYFFIIDEINRGNLSKIFGELLLSIEENYRGKQPVTLAYSKESFTVPENLYIIGMMNTADRSLALIDYALRRRFSFYSMKPAFDSEGFKKYQSTLHNKKLDKLIEVIKSLNMAISEDESLGDGFCIGHSYFCNKKLDECTDSWLSEVVNYDILPTLHEYWFDDKDSYDTWYKELSGVLNAN